MQYPIKSFTLDCSNTNVQEYVTENFEKMRAAYRKAGERLEREAANRKELYDVKASEQKLDPGTLVFLRNHVKGRYRIIISTITVIVTSITFLETT
jgi:hypothetical protein